MLSAAASATPHPTTTTLPDDPGALFQDDGPINPSFVHEAVRTLMRALPLEDEDEPRAWSYRRMCGALNALSALRPRDEIELMLAVQALAAYHAASACWYVGMNLKRPYGDSTRHIAAAASASRTFDTMLKALERRQARSLPAPERPAPQHWARPDLAAFVTTIERACRMDDPVSGPDEAVEWTQADIEAADLAAEADRIAAENDGLDLANTDGILPDGGMIMPENPTPQQQAYIARRLGLACRHEHAENLRRGIRNVGEIRPLRTGDLVP